MNMRNIVGVLILTTLILVGCTSYEIRGERLYEIERAVEVLEGENKFIEFRRIGFGGAGAGGIGAPQIRAASAAQFAELVPVGETVYTWWETPRFTRNGLKQVYWAFIENRAGLLIWETIYNPGSCRFEYMTETEIVLSTGNSMSCGPTENYGPRPGWTKVGVWEND